MGNIINSRIKIVAASKLESFQKTELLKLLKETFQGDLDRGQFFGYITTEMKQGIIRGHSIKPQNFSFKIGDFVFGLIALIDSSTPIGKISSILQIVILVLKEMKIEIDEKGSFILFSLHNSGNKEFSRQNVVDILASDWKVYPYYKLGDEELSHTLNTLSRMNAIRIDGDEIQLIEEIVTRF